MGGGFIGLSLVSWEFLVLGQDGVIKFYCKHSARGILHTGRWWRWRVDVLDTSYVVIIFI